MALVQFTLSSVRNEISVPRFAPMLIHTIACPLLESPRRTYRSGDSPSSTLTVVSVVNWNRFTIFIQPEETIYDLKWKLAVAENINPGHYILLRRGETLHHEQTLKHYGLFSGCTLYMGVASGNLNTSTLESWSPITLWVNVVGTGERLKVMAQQGSTTVRSVKIYVSRCFGMEVRGCVISRREDWRPLDESGTLWDHQIWDETSLYIRSQDDKPAELLE